MNAFWWKRKLSSEFCCDCGVEERNKENKMDLGQNILDFLDINKNNIKIKVIKIKEVKMTNKNKK